MIQIEKEIRFGLGIRGRKHYTTLSFKEKPLSSTAIGRKTIPFSVQWLSLPIEMTETISEGIHHSSLGRTGGTGKYWLAIGIEALIIVILFSMLSFEYNNSPFFQSYVNNYFSSFGGLIFWNLLTIAFVFTTAYYAIQKPVFKD